MTNHKNKQKPKACAFKDCRSPGSVLVRGTDGQGNEVAAHVCKVHGRALQPPGDYLDHLSIRPPTTLSGETQEMLRKEMERLGPRGHG